MGHVGQLDSERHRRTLHPSVLELHALYFADCRGCVVGVTDRRIRSGHGWVMEIKRAAVRQG